MRAPGTGSCLLLARQAFIQRFLFRLNRAYIDDLCEVPQIQLLKRAVKTYDLTILMIDCTSERFMDVYCYWID